MKLKIKITLTEEMLGTKPANKDVFSDFIASKCPDGDARKEELDTAEHREEAGTTVFHRDADGCPMIWDYQILGFCKDACKALRQVPDTASSKLTAFKTKIDGLLFVTPRKIRLNLPEGGEIGICERPLRAETAQGPRVSLARSETVPAGTWFEVEFALLNSAMLSKPLHEWLEYGALRGLGQWRNSGKGRFEFVEVVEG